MNRRNALVFVVLLLLGLVLRLYFGSRLPFTNDEGAYLYDAKTILAGRLPGGDALTKSPVAIMLFSGAVYLSHGSLYATRAVSLIASLLTLIPLLFLVGFSENKRLIFIAFVWLLFSGPVLLSGLGHTEAVANFFATSALALLMLGVRYKKNIWLIVVSGGLFLLALGSRKTSLALFMPIAVAIFQSEADKAKRNKIFAAFVFGLVSFAAISAVFIGQNYGLSGIKTALGSGYLNIITRYLTGDASVSIWGISKMESLKILSRIATSHVILGFIIVLPAIISVIFKRKKIFGDPMMVPLSWLAALTILYAIWPTFLPDYFVDFFVPLSLLVAMMIENTWRYYALIPKAIIVGCFIAVNMISYFSVRAQPWTGMFNVDSVKQASELLKKTVPGDQAIFTAATIVPYLSGHRVYSGVSHPLWYRYTFISEQEKNTFLPPWEEISAGLRPGGVDWLLFEHLTDYAYFRNSDQLINELEQNWELTATIPNDTGFRANTLKLYKRK